MTIPGLLIALGYEAIFRAPISEIFPGLYQTVEASIEERLADMEKNLQHSTTKGRKASSIAANSNGFGSVEAQSRSQLPHASQDL